MGFFILPLAPEEPLGFFIVAYGIWPLLVLFLATPRVY